MNLSIHSKKRIDFYLGTPLVLALKLLTKIAGSVFHQDHSLTPKREIHFLKLLGGGSLFIAYPAILGLRLKYPDIKIDLITTPGIKPFAELMNVFDEIHIVDDRGLFGLAISSLKTLKNIFRSDTMVDLEVYSRLSSVFMLLACVRNRIGFYTESSYWRSGISTHLLFFNRSSGTYTFYDQIATVLGASPASIEECRSRLAVPTQKDRSLWRIGVGHGCSSLSLERMLDASQWCKTLEDAWKELQKDHHDNVVFEFFGVKSEGALADTIIQNLTHKLPGARFLNHCGSLSLKETALAMNQLNEFYAIDSALLHLARLLNLKVTSFWGPTDPKTLLRPIPGLQEKVHYKSICCSPCVHVAEVAPCGGNNLCIQGLFTETDTSNAQQVWLMKT